ncbi:VTC domain-containing protein [Opitutaceae bacterium]|nr:VTC domain-containing protein [Opitutaceae bacterium]
MVNLVTDDFRHERKLLPVGYAHADVLGMISRHSAGFREVYAPRWINNIYLDSPRLDDYHDHVTGLAERSKSRIRWYGDLRGAISKPVFERKCKQGTLNRKLASAVPPLTLNGCVDESGLRNEIHSLGSSDPLSRCLDERQPSLINRYHRHYYLSGDGRIRLTVDSELTFFTPDRTTAMLASSAPEEFAVVIELKYAPDDSDRAAEIANRFPCRIARCSKYVLGIEAIRRA